MSFWNVLFAAFLGAIFASLAAKVVSAFWSFLAGRIQWVKPVEPKA
jgi:hypothetical protein